MNTILAQMVAGRRSAGAVRFAYALRESIQQIVLLGLWRARFFENASFYGGTALRLVHGMDRFSEDLDFSLLEPDHSFDMASWEMPVIRELGAFGIDAAVSPAKGKPPSPIRRIIVTMNERSAFIEAGASEPEYLSIPPKRLLKVRLEADVMPATGFLTVPGYIYSPLPFQVRCHSLPDLFASKMHAVLSRRWRNRVKGRDWHDMVWFAAHHPDLHLDYLTEKMKLSGEIGARETLDERTFRSRMVAAIDNLDIDSAIRDVEAFVTDPAALAVWSKDFFRSVAERIRLV
ncbi:MAG: hypothetical protein AO396_04900 [Candidatus Fermentibacter daniensis]|jgi:predicted nucleotidyltransferase component of viral defense system|nr:MAG: hypothetical protein AO396_04900 [Candidatus Fermentibacter daniensis]KZD19627.1 MAG: hypothetical protein AO394_09810 [Candidatus Fermentibacter daniensis]